MIERSALLMEILSVLLCIHILYGKKFSLNIKNIIVIAIDVILLQLISEEQIMPEMNILIYFIIFGYCVVQFGFSKRELIVNNILYIVILGLVQVGMWIILEFFHIIHLSNSESGINNLLVNTIILLIVLFIFPHIGLHKFSVFM